MKITLLSVGHKFEPHEEAWIGVFEQRLQRFADLDCVRVKDGPKAWDELRRKIPEKSTVVLLDDKGDQPDTEGLRRWLDGTLLRSSSIAFIVGGAYGFPPEAYELAAKKLSLSRLTFAHRIAHLVFLEQLYRVFCLRAGHPYHHA